MNAFHAHGRRRILLGSVAWTACTLMAMAQPFHGPLRVGTVNPRYFTDDAGNAIYLTGSHTWANFQDQGGTFPSPPPVFDYGKYLDFLQMYNHNFFRLWVMEQSRWTLETSDDLYWFFPGPWYKRTGPGNANDSLPRFNLDSLDDSYFARVRQHVVLAGERGMYVSIMLFNGWNVTSAKGGVGLNNPWKGHPFNKDNNVNGIDGDTNGDSSGIEIQHLVSGGGDGNAAVTAYQIRYVHRVIDEVNDLDNVLYEISNESDAGAVAWQYLMIDSVKAYEQAKPKQHPVGMSAMYPGGSDQVLYASHADWVAPANYSGDADGAKVIVYDTDHTAGIGGDEVWVWESFCQGFNTLFMDGYDGSAYGNNIEGFDTSLVVWKHLRAAMGQTRAYSLRMDLQHTIPNGSTSSTGFCLEPTGTTWVDYLAYSPVGASFTVNLSKVSGDLNVEWFNTLDGTTITGTTVTAGSTQSFNPPFSGESILYLYRHPPAGVDETAAPPSRFKLHQNYPNPFNPETTITADIPVRSRIELGIYDLLGRRVRMLFDGERAPGTLSARWDGKDDHGMPVGSGVYFCMLKGGGHSSVGRMLLLR